MRLIWKLPDNDGGERIKSYVIEKKCVADKAWTKVNISLPILQFVHDILVFSGVSAFQFIFIIIIIL